MIKCFWLEPTDRAEAFLRRYERHSYDPLPPPSCPGNRMQYHDTEVSIGEIAYSEAEAERASRDDFPRDDPRWPRACDVCGAPYRDEDHWQYNVKRLYSGAPDGKLYTIRFGPRMAPPGSMYDADWYPTKGPDGIALAVVVPGQDHVWLVDSRASNCTLPDDNEHRCWVRHGDPRTGNVHVDKNRRTCAAGAGSIQMGSYHGFLHNGSLTPA